MMCIELFLTKRVPNLLLHPPTTATTQMRHHFCLQRSRQDALARRVQAAERLCESVLTELECLRRQLEEALVREVVEIKGGVMPAGS